MIDPLGVISSCQAVVAQSKHVRIQDDAIDSAAAELAVSGESPSWDVDLHYRATGEDGDERTAMWLMVLDALNFCFWGQGLDPQVRWRVRWKDELVDGYVALVAALTRAIERGYPLHDASWVAAISEEDVAEVLAPDNENTIIPLFDDRVRNLRELGEGLIPYGTRPATAFIQSAEGSAIKLVRKIVATFPSFNDVTTWPYNSDDLSVNEVRFYKRAQILAGDLAGGLTDSPLAEFRDLNHLTAFADYKVPQILREMGVLVYDDHLAGIVDSRIRIPAGSREEIEIRAATIVACDRLVKVLAEQGKRVSAAELDWHLWSLSQSLGGNSRPYHLTETIFY